MVYEKPMQQCKIKKNKKNIYIIHFSNMLQRFFFFFFFSYQTSKDELNTKNVYTDPSIEQLLQKWLKPLLLVFSHLEA